MAAAGRQRCGGVPVVRHKADAIAAFASRLLRYTKACGA